MNHFLCFKMHCGNIQKKAKRNSFKCILRCVTRFSPVNLEKINNSSLMSIVVFSRNYSKCLKPTNEAKVDIECHSTFKARKYSGYNSMFLELSRNKKFGLAFRDSFMYNIN